MLKRFSYYFLILLIGGWGIFNLFKNPSAFYTSHDGYTHTARIAQYYQALKDGQLPPRWAGTLNNGFGSPIFVFSYHLPYILGSFLHAIGFSYVVSFKLLIGGSLLISGIFMFLFLETIFPVQAAVVGSLFYMFAPYRFLNIYVRGSLSESVAFMFIPLVFLSITKLWEKTNRHTFSFSVVSFALLLLSQNLVAAMFLPLVLAWILLLWKNTSSRRFALYSFGSLVLGFGIASFSYFPVFFEKKFLRFGELITYYQNHFVAPFQFLRSPWGYGFSFPGTSQDEMSFQIGLIHLLVMVFAFIVGIFLWRKKKQKNFLFEQNILLFSFVFSLIAVLVMIDTSFTRWLWRVVPFLATVDLPWRFLGILVFTSSLIVAFVATVISNRFFWFCIVLLLLYANRNHIRVNQYLSYPDEEFALYRGSATWLNEYTPAWRNTTSFDEVTKRYRILEGDLMIVEKESLSQEYILETNATSSGLLQLNILYFPGWKLFLDGKPGIFKKDFYISDREYKVTENTKSTGLIHVYIPEGHHTLLARFTETPLRRFGNVISLVSLGITGGFLLKNRLGNNL